jgi:hypothetical protein
MPRRVALCLSTLALLVAAPRVVEAKCAGPGLAVAPASGASTAGVSWVFAPAHQEVEIDVGARYGVAFTVDKVSETGEFTAYRVAVRFRPVPELPPRVEYTIRVKTAYGQSLLAGYVKAAAGPAPTDQVLLEEARYVKDGWTCSHTDAVIARPSLEAPAYRIEWAPTEAAYRAGERSVVVVPASMASFWGGGKKDQRPAIELGYLNCFGETIPEAALAETVYLGIVPLGPWAAPEAPANPIAVRSGSPPHVEVLGDPEPVAEPEPRQFVCGLAAPYHEVAAPEPPRPEPAFPFSLLLALAGVLAGLPLGFRLSRRLSPAALARLDAASLPQLTLIAGALAIAAWAPIAAAGGLLAGISASLAGAVLGRRGR